MEIQIRFLIEMCDKKLDLKHIFNRHTVPQSSLFSIYYNQWSIGHSPSWDDFYKYKYKYKYKYRYKYKYKYKFDLMTNLVEEGTNYSEFLFQHRKPGSHQSHLQKKKVENCSKYFLVTKATSIVNLDLGHKR